MVEVESGKLELHLGLRLDGKDPSTRALFFLRYTNRELDWKQAAGTPAGIPMWVVGAAICDLIHINASAPTQ